MERDTSAGYRRWSSAIYRRGRYTKEIKQIIIRKFFAPSVSLPSSSPSSPPRRAAPSRSSTGSPKDPQRNRGRPPCLPDLWLGKDDPDLVPLLRAEGVGRPAAVDEDLQPIVAVDNGAQIALGNLGVV